MEIRINIKTKVINWHGVISRNSTVEIYQSICLPLFDYFTRHIDPRLLERRDRNYPKGQAAYFLSLVFGVFVCSRIYMSGAELKAITTA
ncbi:hypothetical protein DYU05_13100 [Mucilaginibacter terrenus]|uniref:Uncharacterized protein n=1 Tax=Mucilaginibacter terrenus TaxID=2482727 RepID=A0A3E2NQB4_9SPHI|nr:hypothetical protein [Mucilaginibacter terrenus]RFZ83080.1 hypothetical protein DYU05_13100 [Mucilaginibacter terrenus]